MKLKTEHYNYIKECFSQINIEAIEKHKTQVLLENKFKDFNTRIMYDVARITIPVSWVCNTLYKYVDDTHVKTAYIKAGKELGFIL